MYSLDITPCPDCKELGLFNLKADVVACMRCDWRSRTDGWVEHGYHANAKPIPSEELFKNYCWCGYPSKTDCHACKNCDKHHSNHK